MPSRLKQAVALFSVFLASLFIIRYVLPTFAEPAPVKTPKFGIFYPPTITSTPTATPTPTPTSTPTPTPTSPPVSYPTLTPIPLQRIGFLPYSQRDPRWNDYPDPDGNRIGRCGCGETSVAMILTDYFDRSFTPDTGNYSPPRMWDYYRNERLGTCGTNMEWHKQVLEQYGLRVSKVYGFDPSTTPQVMSNLLAAGYKILLYYYRSWNNIGHYVIVTSVINSQLIVYDPWQLPVDAQPRYIESGVTPELYITIIK